jgi:hypothetical protein
MSIFINRMIDFFVPYYKLMGAIIYIGFITK